jgi:hypothetical protein
MLSTAENNPPKKRTTPNTRYHRKKETLRFGANPSRRPAAQILAALVGETTTRSPNTIASVLNNKLIAVASQLEELVVRRRRSCRHVRVDSIRATADRTSVPSLLRRTGTHCPLSAPTLVHLRSIEYLNIPSGGHLRPVSFDRAAIIFRPRASTSPAISGQNTNFSALAS